MRRYAPQDETPRYTPPAASLPRVTRHTTRLPLADDVAVGSDICAPPHMSAGRARQTPRRRRPRALPAMKRRPAVRADASQRSRVPRAALCLALLVVLATLAAWYVNTAPAWRIRRVEIMGTSDPRLIAAIRALPLTGANILQDDTAVQERAITALPEIASASISRQLPDTLVVHVAPRVPLLLWHTASAELVIATDGTVLGAPQSVRLILPRSLPRIEDSTDAVFTGRPAVAGTRLSSEIAEMAMQLLPYLPDTLGDGSILRYTKSQGFIAVSSRGIDICFGTPADALAALPAPEAHGPGGRLAQAVRFQRDELRAILAVAARRGTTPTWIDLRWGTHPLYRIGA